jgi:hypothetical protein
MVSQIKSLSVKFVHDYFRFDIAEYDHDHQIALYVEIFREGF